MLRNIYNLEAIKGSNYRDIDQEAAEGLAKSIKEIGLQEPIHLFEIETTKELYVISGHHRLEAMRLVHKDPAYSHKVFQAYVTTGTEQDFRSQRVAIQSVVANMLRKDLSLVDRAQAYYRLKTQGFSSQAIGRMVHKDKRTIEMTLNVALLSDDVLTFVKNHPKLKDALVYKVAVKFKKDPQFDALAALKQSLEPKRRGASAASEHGYIKIQTNHIQDRLIRDGSFTPAMVEKIIRILETNDSSSTQVSV